MPRLELAPAAIDEADAAYRWYLRKAGKSIAAGFLDAFRDSRIRVESHPLVSAKHSHGTRVVRLKGYPYLLIFKVLSSGDLYGLAVSHAHRKRAYWKHRLP